MTSAMQRSRHIGRDPRLKYLLRVGSLLRVAMCPQAPPYGRPFAFAAGLPLRAKTVFSRHIRFSDAMQRHVAEHAVRTDRGWIGVHYRCTDLKTD